MPRFGLLPIAVIVIIIAISAHQAFSLKCWACHGGDSHCGKSFKDVDEMDEKEKSTLINCSGGKCVRMTYPISGLKAVVYRNCAENEYVELSCKDSNQNHCEFCDSDGCNGAAQYGSTFLLIVIPVAIAKLLLQ